MNQRTQVIIKDVSVESAIEDGLKTLGVTKDRVNIEILDKGNKGFLGFNRKLAKVKLTLKQEIDVSLPEKNDDPEDPARKDIKLELNSTANFLVVKKDQLCLVNKMKDKYPVVRGGKNVKLYEHGKLTKEPIIVSEDSEIRIEVENLKPKNEIQIRVTEDKLKAFLTVKQKKGKEFEPVILPDPSGKVDFLISTELTKEVKPDKIKLEDIYEKLAELKIDFGIKEEMINQVVENPGQEFLIAEGIAPVVSSDGRIEYIFNEESEIDDLDTTLDKVDHFSGKKIISVKQGKILAVKHRPQTGQPGRNIFDERLAVEPPSDVKLKVGTGVKVIDNKAVATKPGRPVIRGNKLMILDVYTVYGDVNLDVGNIDFHGDVMIKGNVCENFKVQAGGMILVSQNVTKAALEANGKIVVGRNIIGSKLSAGKLSVYYRECYYYLTKLIKMIGKMEKAIIQLKDHKSFKTFDLKKYGDKQLVQLLLDAKYKEIVKLLKEFYDLEINLRKRIDSVTIIAELNSVIKDLRAKINEQGLCRIKSLAELTALREDIEDVVEILSNYNFARVNIEVGYIQNSNLAASGDIIVTKKGAYNSYLNAGNQVRFTGSPGVFRGGRLRLGTML